MVPERVSATAHNPIRGAALAVGLGVLAILGFGVLLGAPALFLGTKALRTAAGGPRRATALARTAVVLGWASVFETAFVLSLLLVTYGLVRAFAGIVVPIAALTLLALTGVDGLSAAIATRARIPRVARVALCVPLSGILLGALVGLLFTLGGERMHMRECDQARTRYQLASKDDDLPAVRKALDTIATTCRLDRGELHAMRSALEAREAAAERLHDEEEREERARAARRAAEKEKAAVATFPEAEKAINAMIAAARAKVFEAHRAGAAAHLNAAKLRLDDFRGTSVEHSKAYEGLASQITELRKALPPEPEPRADHADALPEKVAAKPKAGADPRGSRRGKAPEGSIWDGSVIEVERYLKGVLSDPDSYEHVHTAPVVAEGDYWVVTSSFRSKDPLGTVTFTTSKFFIQHENVVMVR
jgi:hypothetical protein